MLRTQCAQPGNQTAAEPCSGLRKYDVTRVEKLAFHPGDASNGGNAGAPPAPTRSQFAASRPPIPAAAAGPLRPPLSQSPPPSLVRLAVLLLPAPFLPFHYISFPSPSPFPLLQLISPPTPYPFPFPLQLLTLPGSSLSLYLLLPHSLFFLFFFAPLAVSLFPLRLFLSFPVYWFSFFPFSTNIFPLLVSFVSIASISFPGAPRRKTFNTLGCWSAGTNT